LSVTLIDGLSRNKDSAGKKDIKLRVQNVAGGSSAGPGNLMRESAGEGNGGGTKEKQMGMKGHV